MVWQSPPEPVVWVVSQGGGVGLGLLAYGLRTRGGVPALPDAEVATEKSSLLPKQAAEVARAFQRRGGSFAYDP